MANKSKPVKAVRPKAQPPGFTDGAWEFPERLARLANRKGWVMKDLVRISGLQQPTIWKWLHYETEKPNRRAVREIELAAEIPVGSLLQEPEDGIIAPPDAVLTKLEEWADRLGLDESVVGTLTNEELAASLNQFNRQLRGAILGIVHVYRVPLERAIALARKVRREHASMVNSPEGTELYWFTLLISEPLKNESGQFPSSNHIKIVE